jgi:hypothetical protein
MREILIRGGMMAQLGFFDADKRLAGATIAKQASKRIPDSAKKTVRDIRRNTRRHHSAEEKIRIVLEGLRREVMHYSHPIASG